VIVPAAGRGARLGAGVPKALLPLSGEPLMLHAVRRLAVLRPAGMVVVLPEEALPEAVRRWGRALRRAGVTAVVPGGARRQDSVAAGLAALGPGCRWIAIHDAARPFLPSDVAAAVVRAARRTGAAIAALPCADTLKRADRGPTTGDRRPVHIERTLSRERVWCVQTPQVFRRDLLEKAFARAGRRGVTDECRLVEALGVKVAVAVGSPLNFKVTTPEDLALARRVAGMRK
jgi:2-C-methyl-D-erythritol 4-phosphate cytidylyltransferase